MTNEEAVRIMIAHQLALAQDVNKRLSERTGSRERANYAEAYQKARDTLADMKTVDGIRNCGNCIYFHGGKDGLCCYAELEADGEHTLCALDTKSVIGLCGFWEEKIEDISPCPCGASDKNRFKLKTVKLSNNRYVSEIKCPKCGLTARGFCRDNKERSLKSAMIEWENLIVKLDK
jgi:hypothetical protein